MSTTGKAMHYRQRYSEADAATKAARHAGRDAAYRAALGISHDEPLPKSLGTVSASGRGGMQLSTHCGGRLRPSHVYDN